ncbi:hypothetical protein GJI79_05335 [Lactococcus lactis subsp. cremoris]|nr:hypothetical protein [Lactococcus cremoris]
MIYPRCHFYSFYTKIDLSENFATEPFYSQMNKWSRFGFIFLALGLAFPIVYDFIVGFINGLLKNVN